VDPPASRAAHNVADVAVHPQRFADFGLMRREVGAEKQESDPRRSIEGLPHPLRGLKDGLVFVGAGKLAPDRLERSHLFIIANPRTGEKKNPPAGTARPNPKLFLFSSMG
jgi:hypothetical protein